MSDEYQIQRLKGQFVVVWYDNKKRKRYSLGTSDPREARALAPKIYAELTRAKEPTIGELWADYCAAKQGHAVVRTMEFTRRALAPNFEGICPTGIDERHCNHHIQNRREAGIGDGTIHTELGHLRTVLRWAHIRGRISSCPNINRPAKPVPKPDFLTREECRALIQSSNIPHLRLFIVLALGTGARMRALLGLTWDRVDFTREQIDLVDPTVTQPGKKRAIVPMNASVKRALEQAKPMSLSDYVIEWNGKRVDSVKKGLIAAGERAGIGHVTAHMFRHSAAVHMVEAGVSFPEVAQFLGHSNPQITFKVYGRFSPTHLRKAASVLEYEEEA